jgi:hypothetical protein
MSIAHSFAPFSLTSRQGRDILGVALGVVMRFDHDFNILIERHEETQDALTENCRSSETRIL